MDYVQHHLLTVIMNCIVEAKKYNKERIFQLDWIRTIAIICVVLCHVTELVYGGDPLSFAASPFKTRLVSFSYFCLGRLGVPLFLLLSGFLLLKKEYRKNDIINFYKKNLAPLLFIWMFWAVLYNVFNHLFMGMPLSFKEILSNILYLKLVDMPHSWYMPMIIGIYIFIPYVSNILHTLEWKRILSLIVLLFISHFVIPSVRFYAGDDAIYINNTLDLTYSGGVYGLYLLLGYCIYRYQGPVRVLFSQKLYTFLWCASAVSIFALQVVIGCIYSKVGYVLWYNSPLIIIEGFLMFIFIFTRISNLKKHNISTLLSSQSFGVFLLHVVLLYLFRDFIYKIPIRWLSCIIFTFTIYSISNLCIRFTHMISPKLSYYLYLLKP